MRWLDRQIIVTPFLTLCLSEKDFHAVLTKLELDKEDWPEFISQDAEATVHTLTGPMGTVCIVCAKPGMSPSGIVTTMAHEAYHVWADTVEYTHPQLNPSEELQAIGISIITGRLIDEYNSQRKDSRKKGR